MSQFVFSNAFTNLAAMILQLIQYQDLNFIEFRKGQEAEDMRVPGQDSKYLNGTAFNLFLHVFELSYSPFNYYEPACFSGQSLVALRNHLQDYSARFASIATSDELGELLRNNIRNIDFLNELKTSYPNWHVNWESIRQKMSQLGSELVEFIDECIDDEKSLWVKGY
jgi:hypothetical protein